MAPVSARSAGNNRSPGTSRKSLPPFAGLIDAVLVEDRGDFEFDGAVVREDAHAVWSWMLRDLASDIIDEKALDGGPGTRAAVESLMPDLLERARIAIEVAGKSHESERRLTSQLGGEDARGRLPVILAALKFRGLLDKAQSFGRAANAMTDETGLAQALQSMLGTDQSSLPFLMFGIVGEITAPMRLITAAIRIAGGATEPEMLRSGFGPLIDALMANAQNQIPLLTQAGTFGDIDLVCRAVDRFHRLMRAVTGFIELNRGGTWARVAAALTKSASDRLEPRLRDVAPDLNKSLRKRDGTDRLDSDQILSALNGMYVLATIRDSRDSLALSTLFDQVWTQTGQALEIHVDRLMEALRAHPSDSIASKRLDAALKMIEIRFGQEYADTLRRAKVTTQRRLSS
jgi:hypothetical protein